ncbi:hypothetical protein OBV_12710 [Oscillibacter valericigenes Sjm18-20]|nr:hypothetical protein OBV_12710 [Oscillibacter valericigenes Sjm18-20]
MTSTNCDLGIEVSKVQSTALLSGKAGLFGRFRNIVGWIYVECLQISCKSIWFYLRFFSRY